jgi:GntR family transcriptional regulator
MQKERNLSIERTGAAPAYFQLAAILKEQIEKGVYLPGAKLPSESGLCRKFHVSPMTVRRSIQLLLDEGIVSTIRGSGTYVKAPDLRGGTFAMEEFYTIFSDKARTKVKVIDAQICRADAAIADKLALNEGDRAILIQRLLIRDGDPIIYHQEYLIYDPELRIVESELEVTALQGLFIGQSETTLKWGKLSIEPALLSGEEARLLNTTPMQAAFRLEHLFFDYNGQPVSWGRFICRGDRFRFTTTVGHYTPATP